MRTVDLSRYDNAWYRPGRSAGVRALWLLFGLPVLRSGLPLPSRLRAAVLRVFGASIGIGAVIKPGVSVKYPWHLIVGDHCWIGERAWIDNLTTVRLDHSVCISQGAYLCTGNHDWADPAFGLRIAPIHLANGSWVGAQATVLPGTVLAVGAVAAAGSVVSGHLSAGGIYAGNPAQLVRQRELREVVVRTEAARATAAIARVPEAVPRRPAVAPDGASVTVSSTGVRQ